MGLSWCVWIGSVMIWGFATPLWGIPTVDGLKAALTPPPIPLPHVGCYTLLPAFSQQFHYLTEFGWYT